MANTSTTTATATLELLDLTGVPTGQTALVAIPALGHAARFFDELFPIPGPFRGMLRIRAGATPLSVFALRLRVNKSGRFFMTTIPVSTETSPAPTVDLLIPQVVDGGGFTTQLVIFSAVANQSSTGTVGFIDRAGQPLEFSIR